MSWGSRLSLENTEETGDAVPTDAAVGTGGGRGEAHGGGDRKFRHPTEYPRATWLFSDDEGGWDSYTPEMSDQLDQVGTLICANGCNLSLTWAILICVLHQAWADSDRSILKLSGGLAQPRSILKLSALCPHPTLQDPSSAMSSISGP